MAGHESILSCTLWTFAEDPEQGNFWYTDLVVASSIMTPNLGVREARCRPDLVTFMHDAGTTGRSGICSRTTTLAMYGLAGALKSYRDSLAILDRLYLDWELLARRGFTRIRYSRLQ